MLAIPPGCLQFLAGYPCVIIAPPLLGSLRVVLPIGLAGGRVSACGLSRIPSSGRNVMNIYSTLQLDFAVVSSAHQLRLDLVVGGQDRSGSWAHDQRKPAAPRFLISGLSSRRQVGRYCAWAHRQEGSGCQLYSRKASEWILLHRLVLTGGQLALVQSVVLLRQGLQWSGSVW